ncbi:hypothetical protein SAMN02746041_01834 [Desulfacinum hydrothermale DSM 13146]|uniref:DUF2357 domain-containing protein n=1 Tax=Desulfacinum hydrothermale DSM 13146 TaxID=1121390 RepID=A0A1W1XJ05_9BACT|nr:DUF2357 domain-containing protein [Desulfacinum hydrothermale]SMC23754.1 hypothetical protein SAMN02746041_01834 [Desulfacinum hydrothermale DSM 13146]
MAELFRIETDKVYLRWSGPISSPAYSSWLPEPPPGRLVISLRRHDAVFGTKTWRNEVPTEVANDPSLHIGPRLYEETIYTIYLQSKTADTVELRHSDPTILRGLNRADDGRTIYGSINFRGQIGRTLFTIYVGGSSEFDFETEIFPSKLDYTTDYKALLADVQDILTALVLEYLKSTFHLAITTPSGTPTQLEWLILLRHVIDKLERGMRYIEQHPHQGLSRERMLVKSHSVRRPDPVIFRAIIQGKGAGPRLRAPGGISIRSKLPEARPRPTLDTPEHRWLAFQLTKIRRELAQIQAKERVSDRFGPENARANILEEIAAFENRIARLQETEPIAAAVSPPPAGFASLTLQTAPGYREAYRSCLILLRGLRLEGGPVGLSVKEIHILYEYWCYLSIIRLLAELLNERIPVERLLTIEHDSLRVRLQRGHKSVLSFKTNDSRTIGLTYNPTFKGGGFILPQRPDIVLALNDPDWPTVRLVLDAKYRIETSQDYVAQFGSPGPPEDAINVLHRYRDAILEESNPDGPRSERLKRSVVEGAALFPYVDKEDNFSGSRFWISLERMGIGAIPFLPSETRYVKEWLQAVLRRGGWKTADLSIPHVACQQSRTWKEAAKEAVLVAVLRPSNAAQHLEWICRERQYYAPLTPSQRRQFVTRWIAIYSPTSLRKPGAVTHVASVKSIEVLKREDIQTPWGISRSPDELQVVYHLSEVKPLKSVIENRGGDGRGKRFSQNRWTSRLGLERAKELRELFLETEPEWRLYEELRAAGVDFTLKPGRPTIQDEDTPAGRCWFFIKNALVQYRGSAGFLIRRTPSPDEYRSTVSATLKRLVSDMDTSHAI